MIYAWMVCLLAACHSERPEPIPVAARINSNEITIPEIDEVLNRTGLTTGNLPGLRKAALENLIDQELAFEQARNQNLDRTPEVFNAMEAAKRKVLAQAYLQQLIWQMPKPGKAEVRQYYDAHPELFSQRRVYELRVLALEPSAGVRKSLQDMMQLGKSLDEMASFLERHDVAYSIETGTRAAEQLPFETLGKLLNARVGSLVEIETASGWQIVMIKSSRLEAIDLARAYQRIEHFLFNQNATLLTKRELDRLRENASIEYVNDPLRNEFPMTMTKAPGLNGVFPDRVGSVELHVKRPR